MSNDNPFVAPGNDGSAPLQAPPAEQNQVPPFGGAPIPGAATQAPIAAQAPGYGYGYGYGYPGVPAGPPQPLRAARGLPVAMAVLGAVYVLLCLVELFELNHRISLIKQLTGDVDADSGLLNQIDSATHTENALYWVALVVFFSIIITLSVWLSRLRKAWGPTGHYQRLLKESGYQVFRIIWIVSLVISVVLRGNGAPAGAQDAISHDHQLMVYFGIRAALGALLVYFALRFVRVSTRIMSLTQAGYSQDAVNYLSS